MFKTSQSETPPRPVLGRAGSPSGREWPLVGQGPPAAAAGSVWLVELDAARDVDALPGGSGERGYVVCEGSLDVAVEDRRCSVSAGAAIYLPEGRLAAGAAGGEGATFLAIGVPEIGDGSRVSAGAAVFSIASVDDEPVHDPARGFFELSTRWLVNGRARGSTSLAVGLSTFPPGARHALHRHREAEEFFLVVDGVGAHLIEGGDVTMTAGDVVHVPRGEWHGFRNRGNRPVRAIFGYFGTKDPAESGYELHPAAG